MPVLDMARLSVTINALRIVQDIIAVAILKSLNLGDFPRHSL